MHQCDVDSTRLVVVITVEWVMLESDVCGRQGWLSNPIKGAKISSLNEDFRVNSLLLRIVVAAEL